MARARKYRSNAARQKAYRKRLAKRNASYNGKAKQPRIKRHCKTCTFLKPCRGCLLAWNRLLVRHNLSMSRGMFMLEAAQGCGLLVTGGYDLNKCALIQGIHEQDDGKVRGGANFVARLFNGDFIYRRANDGGDDNDSMEQARAADAADRDEELRTLFALRQLGESAPFNLEIVRPPARSTDQEGERDLTGEPIFGGKEQEDGIDSNDEKDTRDENAEHTVER